MEQSKTIFYPNDCLICRGIADAMQRGITTTYVCIEHGRPPVIGTTMTINLFNKPSEDTNLQEFTINDSGKREEFNSGMVRDTQVGKPQFTRILDGPMFDRWAIHLTKATAKYADIAPGKPNWTLADGEAELHRFRESAFRHFRAWLSGKTDEDHASATFFNINGYEYVKEKLEKANGKI